MAFGAIRACALGSRSYLLALAAVGLLAGSCGEDAISVTGTGCTSGETAACSCPDGTPSTRVCTAGVFGDCGCIDDASVTDTGAPTDIAGQSDASLSDTVVIPDGAEPGDVEGDVAPDAQHDLAAGACIQASDCPPADNGCKIPACLDGKCVVTLADDASPCDDNDACTTGDACLDAKCVGVAKSCDDGLPCTTDGCTGGACTHLGNALVCDDGNPCTTDACDGTSGCVHTNNTEPCSDGSVCTVEDACAGGACKGGASVQCADGDPCTDDGCDPVTGCTFSTNSAPCSDNNACTSQDLCVGGVCMPGPATSCNDDNLCTTDACDPTAGCVHPANTLPCDDGNACTIGDACTLTTCSPGSAAVCADDNPCTDDSCAPASGCVFTNNSAACSDNNNCTQGDACKNGVCTPSAPSACDDGNPCTTENCDATGGCTTVDNTAPCSDGSVCTSGDTCANGTCVAGSALPCFDGNPCTDDACDPAKGCTFANNSGSCSDSNVCTDGDQCAAGQCIPGLVKNCDDANACTADSCAPGTGCQHLQTSQSCDDGDACTTGETCANGACGPGKSVVCNDGTPCTADLCDPTKGCTFTNQAVPCSDGNACTVNDTCLNGVCGAGAAYSCDDNNVCTADSCNPTTGCVNTNTTIACDDNDACTQGDACAGGTCVGGSSQKCDDGNPCTDDSCNKASGCAHVANSAACSDNNACTLNDSCAGSACVSGTAPNCSDDKLCTTDSCDPSSGCTHANNNMPCDDGDACTLGDACASGACAAGQPLPCADANPCTDDTCDKVLGCQHVNNTLPCSDNNNCTTGDTCKNGICTPTAPTTCEDGNPCTTESCDVSGGCAHVNNTAPCDDGSACTVGDACSAGLCTAGAPVSCDDSNPCTDDACQKASGCSHLANSATCTDGNVCTTGDACKASACTSSGIATCDDANPCTTDSCDPTNGCSHTANTATCDDGNPCTITDVCSGSACTGSGTLNCDDSNLCTTDSCTAGAGCAHTNNALACKDNNLCTTGDTCSGGTCIGAAPVDCSDSNVCTTDSCAAATGCAHTNNALSCTDNNPCTTTDACAGGVCVGGAALGCDDANPCTNDSCAPATGCVHMANTAACADGNACTTGDACANSVCVGGGATNCDDGKVCTTDTCSSATGCAHANNTAACDDGNACTFGDVCAAGACTSAVLTTSLLSTAAGSNTTGMVDGTGVNARFNGLTGISVAPNGVVWLVDSLNSRIRMIGTDGTVSTIAGATADYIDGAVSVARFNNPAKVVVDAAGKAYVTDTGNQRIRTISSTTGSVATLAGAGVAGYLDGAAASAMFSSPKGIAINVAGTLYVADTGNARIRTVSPLGVVGTFAGNGTSNYQDGAASSAAFVQPVGVCVDAANGTVYVADGSGHTIRKIAGGQVTTLAGANGSFGMVDGWGGNARFNTPIDCAVDANHDIWVVDGYNFRLRRVTSTGYVTSVVGATVPPGSATDPGNQTAVDGQLVTGAAPLAIFMHPNAVAQGTNLSTFWVADNGRVRELVLASLLCDDGVPCTSDACSSSTGTCAHTALANGSACTTGTACISSETCLAGVCQGGSPTMCDDSNACTTDSCNSGTGACAHTNLTGTPCSDGNACTPGDICVTGACSTGHAIVTTLAGTVGTPTTGYVDGVAASARFNTPSGVALADNGKIYVADSVNNAIRVVATDGTTSTAAGTASAGYVDGTGGVARFSAPSDIALESAGSFVIADSGNQRIRRLTGTTVSTVAGSGTAGYLDGAGSSARFSNPTSVDASCSGIVYVADAGNHRIRAIASDGTVSTLAGSGASGGTNGAVSSATFATPSCVRVTPTGAVWVVDSAANTVRRIWQGNVTNVAGVYNVAGALDGVGTYATFNHPTNCALDKSGNLYVADSWNYRIRRVTPNAVVTTIAGSTAVPATGAAQPSVDGIDGIPSGAALALPLSLAAASTGYLWLGDSHTIRRVSLPYVDCSDGQECTTDTCLAASGTCQNTVIPTGGACEDGNICTIGETCTSGVCSGAKPACDDSNACTLDGCTATGQCAHSPVPSVACCAPFAATYAFDSGSTAPVTLGGPAGTVVLQSATVYSGSYAIGITDAATGVYDVTVPVTWVPVGTTKVAFRYYYTSSTPGTLWGANTDTFVAKFNGTTVWTLPSSAAEATWTTVSVDISAFAGTPGNFELMLTRTVAPTTALTWKMFLDDVSVTSTCP